MPPTERKRPFYVVLALLAALAMGTAGASSGWALFETYREPIDPTLAGQGVADEGDRAAVVARYEAYLKVLDRARSRGWPIAVGMLVLGTGVLVGAVRTLGGRRGARPLLLQLVVAQAVLSGVSYLALGDVLDAEVRLREARQAAEVHRQFPQEDQHEYADQVLHMSRKLLRVQARVELAIGTLCSGLIVLALTRRRARDFFDASAEPLGGR
ncbi:MAG: hypothetical protein ACRENE_29055 [Polyangiaceae bacterium]